ncbi:MAG: cyclodeaminase/cyclohydrolase family protein [Aerococcus sp.]|nr:cyclodeaminase/cyclohydrolase family protein [Aerococcus sp.]
MLKDTQITTFVDELAAEASTPGGGSAAALSAALGVSSILMAIKFSRNAKKNSDVQEKINRSISQLETYKDEFVALIDEDIKAFEPLSDAFKLPKSTDEEKAKRHNAIQKGTIRAIEPQVTLKENAEKAIALAQELLPHIKKNIISDLAVGVQMLRSAYLGNITDLYINVRGIDDAETKAKYLDLIDDKQSDTLERVDSLYNQINQDLRDKI